LRDFPKNFADIFERFSAGRKRFKSGASAPLHWHLFCKGRRVKLAGFWNRIAARRCCAVFAMGLLLPLWASAKQQVTLAWQPSPDPDVAGYNVYCGVTSGAYESKITVTNTLATIPNLLEGSTYYFAVTAFKAGGVESVPSNEVSYVVPGVRLTIKKLAVKGFQNSVLVGSTGVVNFPWTLEATHDLKKWRTLAHGSNSPVNVAVVAQGTPWLFIRLRSQ
jgi:Fibronectin type III domain